MSSDRSFGLLLGAFFLITGLLRSRWWAIALAAILITLALVAPATLRQPKRAWLFLGYLIGRVMNPIVLGVVYFAIVSPVGVVMRWCGRDPLRLRRDPAASTYWRTRSGPPPDMRLQF